MTNQKRLSKALAAAGVASRRASEELIFAGRVKVNGEVVRIPQTLVDWEQDRISVDETPLSSEEEKLYFMLNKPAGYLCTSERPGAKRIVLDLFAEQTARLFTVGRLDRDTTGLLLVTNDGHFANRVIHPSAKIEKEYLVKAMQEITADHLATLSEGARIDDRWIKPLGVEKVRRGTFKIRVKEGRKHEVRILAERAGLRIVELKRIRIGGLLLASLPEGEYRPLSEKDRNLVLKPKVGYSLA
jgi:23S rRNA pseudouridine2605 synthase